ncbi:hypothetical protein [Arthrobacter sp. NQ4]|uniref:hypothetical protein n=1 Tax=Arthrobacter sp. NQ4 TaxID=3027930 RepID=UPI0023AECCA4|nr:hypothetical protein [Arthrobacter sp. NQ4]MDE8588954.1 hypothetical protein [Arthrobacter sp. NQ4]
MDDAEPNLALYVEGESALVAGTPEAVTELFRKLDVQPEATSNLGSALTDMLALAAGVAGAFSSAGISGNSFQMTSESYARYLQLAGSTKEKFGIVSGVLRQPDGTIDTVVELMGSTPNPAAMVNPYVLAATLAIRTAIHSLEVQLKSIDAKLDVVLRDARNEALGNIQGTSHILDKAFGYFEDTGMLSDTLWDQVAGQSAQLAQMQAVALNHIDGISEGLEARGFGKRLNAAQFAASGELQHWLIITAVALTNMVRMDSLEIVRGAAEGNAVAHAEHVERSRKRRRDATKAKLQRLAEAAAKAAKADMMSRVMNPLEMPKLYDSVAEINRLLKAFSDAYDMPLNVEFQRKEWHESVMELGQAAGTTVAGAVSAVAGGVAAAPKAIAGGVEDGILHVAKSIEERRKVEADD